MSSLNVANISSIHYHTLITDYIESRKYPAKKTRYEYPLTMNIFDIVSA